MPEASARAACGRVRLGWRSAWRELLAERRQRLAELAERPQQIRASGLALGERSQERPKASEPQLCDVVGREVLHAHALARQQLLEQRFVVEPAGPEVLARAAQPLVVRNFVEQA